MDEKIVEEMLKELNNCGFEIKDYCQLWTLKTRHKFLIPILLKYLGRFETKNFKEVIVRALGVKGFNDATSSLIDEYYNSDNRFYKWAIGNSISIILDERFEKEYIEIINDKTNGTSRQMFVLTLGKLRCIKAIDSLVKLLEDDDINGHVIMALGYFKNKELLDYIEPFLKNEQKWIRREAEKSIKKLNQ